MSPVAVALDIGGTKIATATVTADGVSAAPCSAPTPAQEGPEAILRAAADLVLKTAADLLPRAAGTRDVVGVGVGSAGVVDPGTGLVRSATDALPGWGGTDLRGGLREALGLPVTVVNDVHAHALGEYWRGAARGHATVLFVAVGTGVGASVLLNGGVHHGARSAAGHAGHVPVAAAAGRRCPCGAEGHVEAVASGPALLREYRERTGESTPRLREVADAAERGDPTARVVLSEGGGALGSAVAGLANVLAPDVIVVGGGVTGVGEPWWRALREETEQGLIPALRGLPLVPTELGADAALLGAGHLAWREFG